MGQNAVNRTGASAGSEVDGGRAMTETFTGMDGLIHISRLIDQWVQMHHFQSAGLKWAGKLSVAKLSVMKKESAAANTQLQCWLTFKQMQCYASLYYHNPII